ncbi:MAG: septum formation initiator family protein [Alphaproteobacteria bacterium]|nr:septum formation initiator family protein [Alphaproteobacteria bacterium]
MNLRVRNFQRLSQKAIAPFMVLSVMGYFIYHSIQGERGLLAWFKLQERFQMIESQLREVAFEREELEEKVQALRPESINRDLLDQQARQKLGYTHPDDVVILRIDNPT